MKFSSFTYTIIFLIIATLSLPIARAAAPKVNAAVLAKAMESLVKTATNGSKDKVSFRKETVKGNSVDEMLRSYADAHEYEKSALLLQPREVPQSGDDDIVGFTRSMDVVNFAVDLYRQSKNDEKALWVLRRDALKALNEAVEAGASVGAEGRSWDACGVYFPGLIILDPKAKLMYSLVPDNTDC